MESRSFATNMNYFGSEYIESSVGVKIYYGHIRRSFKFFCILMNNYENPVGI